MSNVRVSRKATEYYDNSNNKPDLFIFFNEISGVDEVFGWVYAFDFSWKAFLVSLTGKTSGVRGNCDES